MLCHDICQYKYDKYIFQTVLDTLGNPVDVEEFSFIPRYDVQASAGFGQFTEDNAPRFTMAFRSYWIKNHLNVSPSSLSVINVRGDSMEGVLNDKDVILINHQDTQAGDGLYVLRLGNDLYVKRVQRLPHGKLLVSSANPSYAPFEVDLNTLDTDVAIIGKVVWFGRTV